MLLAVAQLPGGALQVKGAVRDPRARHLAQFQHQETNSKCLQLEDRCPFRLGCWLLPEALSCLSCSISLSPSSNSKAGKSSTRFQDTDGAETHNGAAVHTGKCVPAQ